VSDSRTENWSPANETTHHTVPQRSGCEGGRYAQEGRRDHGGDGMEIIVCVLLCLLPQRNTKLTNNNLGKKHTDYGSSISKLHREPETRNSRNRNPNSPISRIRKTRSSKKSSDLRVLFRNEHAGEYVGLEC
jgi:hypothetical protein